MRGEVWLVVLDPTIGREIKKTRPALVVSPDELNVDLETVIVSPMSTGGLPAPFRIPLVFQGKKGLIFADRFGRLISKGYCIVSAAFQEKRWLRRLRYCRRCL